MALMHRIERPGPENHIYQGGHKWANVAMGEEKRTSEDSLVWLLFKLFVELPCIKCRLVMGEYRLERSFSVCIPLSAI
jgi:hypothetical protein